MNIVWGRPPVRLWRKGLNGRLVKNTMATWLLVSGILFYFLIIGCSCNDDILPPQKPVVIQLSADDVGVTEAWIKVTTNDAKGTFALKRDSITVAANLHSPIDTVIYDAGLLPKHTYNYFADTDTPLTITTMDTTSHNFTWQIDTLGDGASSVLYDVAIINDTLAYAVGEVYKRDSMGQWETTPYNVARWNGEYWELMRVKFRLDYGTSVIFTYTSISSVFAISANDIWFCHHIGGVTRYKDGNWVMLEFSLNDGPGGANKMWGTSSSDIFFVSDVGRITHYNGSAWQKIESSTTLDIFDIYGAFNPKINRYEILAVASDPVGPRYEKKLLEIEGTTVTSLLDSGLSKDATSIWFKPERKYYIVGSGIYQKQNLSDSVWRRYAKGEVTSYSSSSVRGNDINDVFVAGSIFEIVHFNGITWHKYSDLTRFTSGAVSGVIKDNLAVFVGIWNSRAIAIIGKRNGGVSKR